MKDSLPIDITASRSFYLVRALFAVPLLWLGLWMTGMALTRHSLDIGMLIISGTILFGGAHWTLITLGGVLMPPRLLLDADGLRYSGVLRTQRWAWREVESLYTPGQPGQPIAFSWNAPGRKGPVRRRMELTGAFAGLRSSPKPLYDRMVAAWAAARSQPRPDVPPRRWVVPRLSNPFNRLPWLKWVMLVIVALAFLAFLAFIDTVFTSTELIVPTDRAAIDLLEWLTIVPGFALAILLPYGFEAMLPEPMTGRKKLIMGTILAPITLMLSAGLLHDYTLRTQELVAFWGVNTPFEQGQLRVRWLRAYTTKGNTRYEAVARVPHSTSVNLSLSKREYRLYPTQDLGDYDVCYPVMLQRSGKALRMLKISRADEGEMRLIDCQRDAQGKLKMFLSEK